MMIMLSGKTKNEKSSIDSAFFPKKSSSLVFDMEMAGYVKRHKIKSILFSKSGKTDVFYTNDSNLYFMQRDLEKRRRGEKILGFGKKLDCILPSEIREKLELVSRDRKNMSEEARERLEILRDYWLGIWESGVGKFGLSRAWNVSIVCSVIFGMFLMTMLYRYLGQDASAGTKNLVILDKPAATEVLGDTDSKEDDEITQKLLAEYQELLKKGSSEEVMADKIREMTKGYPIEKMADEIARKDKVVAAFLVGIAMKESTWGKHVPVLDGKDCYNYWGYRGKRERMGTGGHTCFDSREDAVNTVSKRLEFLVKNEKVTTPEKMVTVWKCGYDCSWDDKKNVEKWISDVDKYFGKLNDVQENKM